MDALRAVPVFYSEGRLWKASRARRQALWRHILDGSGSGIMTPASPMTIPQAVRQ